MAIATVGTLGWRSAGWWPTVIVGFFWLLWVADLRDRDAARTRDREATLAAQLEDEPLPDEAAAFMRTLDERLDLPSADRVEIRAELTDHLADTIAAITADGLGRQAATREAVARLGDPMDLARQFTRAHQTTRRLFAGVGGGILEAGVGAAKGYFIGLAIGLAITALAATALRPLLNLGAERFPDLARAASDGAGVWTAIIWAPAFVAGRELVRAVSRVSRRRLGRILGWWAMAGSLLLALLLLFVVPGYQTWLMVCLEAGIPLAFAAGVLVRPDRPLSLSGVRLRRWLAPAFAGLVAVALLAGPTPGTASSDSWRTDDGKLEAQLNAIAPHWPGTLEIDGRWGAIGGPVVEEHWRVGNPEALAALHDARFELWRAVPVPGSPDGAQAYLIAPGYTTPYATEPADISTATFSARFDVGHVRTRYWLLVLTAVGHDGIRYRVDWRSEGATSFSGTVWDWLTASS